ncbi:MAG TPA: hypothetical protein VEX60_01560 [Pyrinomonadaceae bacterium]|nr:hypothetical protein [Pyrinomonadaceae bacterium]
MPVIGRLDGQVEDVIISPISRRRGDVEPTKQQPGEEDAPATPATQTQTEGESSAKTDELPVWLL